MRTCRLCRQTGVRVCRPDGTDVVCTAPRGVPGTETCNGIDDDCDHTIDEGLPPPVGDICAPAAGACDPGRWLCQGGQLVCGAPNSGMQEVCNNVDDDCDALVDESPPGFPLPGEEESCVPLEFEAVGDTGACDLGQTVSAASVCRPAIRRSRVRIRERNATSPRRGRGRRACRECAWRAQ
jgi:hypothetical protein